MRQIRILRNYKGSFGRYFKGTCILVSPGVTEGLIEAGYAEYADAPPTLPSPTRGEENEKDPTERVHPEAAMAPQGENAMKGKAKAR